MACLLGRDPYVNKDCPAAQCSVCGWNPVELSRRERIQQRYGLQLGSDGLRRLIIGQKTSSDPAEESGGDLRKPDRGIWKSCEYCGAKFLAGNNNQRYCHVNCRVMANQRKKESECQGPE